MRVCGPKMSYVLCVVDVSIFSTQHRSLGSVHEPQLQPFPPDTFWHADLIGTNNTSLGDRKRAIRARETSKSRVRRRRRQAGNLDRRGREQRMFDRSCPTSTLSYHFISLTSSLRRTELHSLTEYSASLKWIELSCEAHG